MHHQYGKQYPSHPNEFSHSLTDPSNFHCIVLKCKSFGATLKVDPHLFVFNGIIQTILMAFNENV